MRCSFAPAGCGKGTHGPKIEGRLGVPQLSTGDMLRAAVAAETAVGLEAAAVMKDGGLVSDAIVLGVIRDRIKGEGARCCFSNLILFCNCSLPRDSNVRPCSPFPFS